MGQTLLAARYCGRVQSQTLLDRGGAASRQLASPLVGVACGRRIACYRRTYRTWCGISGMRIRKLSGYRRVPAGLPARRRSILVPAIFSPLPRLRERASDQVRFLLRLVFTPGAGEWAIVRLPAPLFPLYGVIRMFRLGARMLRS